MTSYETIIGLEIHAQISTKTKMFCACDNDSFNRNPNSNVCPICMGFPGVLPVINREAIYKGIKTALALNCTIPLFSKFDRKNYFYPDLPYGYQISQYDDPISKKGAIEIELADGKLKTIGITRLHLENDAGKLTHVLGGSLVDYNRAGTPLMEIVSEPDLRSGVEACLFAKMVQAILRTIGSSDADMEKGMMRFDASVSTRPLGEEKLYPRAEIKNLNSFKALENAIDFESKRQIILWEKGEPQDQQITVGWLDDRQETKLLRTKEDAADYRYFPEPDLPPLHLDKAWIETLRSELPELPLAKNKRFIKEYKISQGEALFFSQDPFLGNYFEEVAQVGGDPKLAASFIGTILGGRLNREGLAFDQCKITTSNFGQLIKLIKAGTISNTVAKSTVFDAMYETGESPEVIVEKNGLKQVSNVDALEEIIKKVISENSSVVADFRSGKQKAFGFLMGQIMKSSNGQANPQLVNEILQKELQV
ncbi:MAG: aspartyl/glutamyl-tRNA(Asn/Gln) amidotransferase subunit B, aspartyl-tRNA(Asn)/glutamyl-tRNA (Gln) amidotransferase subunit B [Candidatus Peregrinibacteria bacterium GW2011_GWF2_39_17]|nr:MAG: aspartyl/glutamyl-tRNA(Asn/Gln) amidotransferase subunit B, aspartyl-tRNA(Asn)/glutamyl-tRNA (Gln) amidotransferase subunit B [Candidatus Peregrinibacteria bacterium GW2011_GWF2_39_17]HCW32314.1 Asp-tRNA(Asn)/Glu-tRNA(Gln) amidotransferase GatCAB subunit B [Candidatus Peregrinibacteria bacterium]